MGVFIRFFFKQKTAYEMRSSDWSSDVCSSDLRQLRDRGRRELEGDVGLRAVLLEVVGPQGRPDDRQVGTQDPVVVQARHELGSASCRERVCQYVSIPVVAVALTRKLLRVAPEDLTVAIKKQTSHTLQYY